MALAPPPGLSPWQQKVYSNAVGLSAAQRTPEQKAVMQKAAALRKSAPTAPQPGSGAAAGGTSGAGASGMRPPRPGDEEDYAPNIPGLPDFNTDVGTLLQNPTMLSSVLGAAGFSGSLDEQLSAAMLGNMFAGVSQFNRNVGGSGGDSLPASLQNVSPTASYQGLRLLVGNIWDMLQQGQDPRAVFAERQAGVPQWARQTFADQVGSDVLGQLMATQQSGSSLPFSLHDMLDPSINLTDPSKPFVAPGANPAALIGLTGMQSRSSELPMLQTISAEDYFRGINPFVRAISQRPAGSESPFPQGLTFGNPILDPVTGEYHKSPVQTSPLYDRWNAWGGLSVAPIEGGEWVAGNARGPVDYSSPESILASIASWDFPGQMAQFAPGQVDPMFIQRLLLMLSGELAPADASGGGGDSGYGPSSVPNYDVDPDVPWMEEVY